MIIQNQAQAKQVLGDNAAKMRAAYGEGVNKISSLAKQGQKIIEDTINASDVGSAEDILNGL